MVETLPSPDSVHDLEGVAFKEEKVAGLALPAPEYIAFKPPPRTLPPSPEALSLFFKDCTAGETCLGRGFLNTPPPDDVEGIPPLPIGVLPPPVKVGGRDESDPVPPRRTDKESDKGVAPVAAAVLLRSDWDAFSPNSLASDSRFGVGAMEKLGPPALPIESTKRGVDSTIPFYTQEKVLEKVKKVVGLPM